MKWELVDVSYCEFEDLVLNSTTKELRDVLRRFKKTKGTKWEQNYIKNELASRDEEF